HFAELKSETRPRDLVKQMSGGQRQAVAIARTRLSNPDIVLMDEPTAAISVRQVAEVLDLIRRLRDQGTAVILISHRMPDVFAVCDHISVMRRGTVVADKPIAHTSPEEVTALITGALERAQLNQEWESVDDRVARPGRPAKGTHAAARHHCQSAVLGDDRAGGHVPGDEPGLRCVLHQGQ